MKFLPLVLAFLVTSHAAAQDAPPVDPRQMLEQLRQLKQKQNDESIGRRKKLMAEFTAAAATNSSAIDFYEQAIKATQFEGENRENTQFHE